MKTAHEGKAVTALATPPIAGKPTSRPCPTCDAQPGQSCRRWIGGRVRGKDIGGGQWRILAKVHPERRAHRRGAA